MRRFFFKTTEDSLDKVQSWTMWRNYRASGSIQKRCVAY